jgi:hypothetical protein
MRLRILLALALSALPAWGQAIVPPATPPYTTNYLYYNKMHWMGNYLSLQIYNSQDLVNEAGTLYVSKVPVNQGHDPASSPTYWDALPGGATPADWLTLAHAPFADARRYNFTPQFTGGGTLTAGTPATVTLGPCPMGISGSNLYPTQLYLSGGTGTPEAVTITGGTCTPGATTGTVGFTPANTHTGSWTIGSATGGLQEATNAIPSGGIVLIPDSTTTIYGTVSFGPNHSYWGNGRTASAITNANDAVYAFQYLSPVLTAQNVIEVTARFEEFTLNSKFGIQMNSDNSASMQFQALLVGGPYVQHVLFNGKYGQSGNTDPNAGTVTTPTEAQLKSYGVALNLNKTFDMSIFGDEFNAYGIGVDLTGCDIGKIDLPRFYNNGRNIHANHYSDGQNDASGNLGSSLKITNGDIIFTQRVGGIYLNSVLFSVISNNFFETGVYAAGTTTVGRYIATTGDFGTQIKGNRFDSMASTNPIVSMLSIFGATIEGNVYSPNAPDATFYCGPGPNYGGGSPYYQIWQFLGNSPEMPVCDYPQALVGPLNPNVFQYNNIPGIWYGQAAATFPFVKSPVTGQWVISTAATPTFEFDMPLNNGVQNFIVQSTGRRNTGTGFSTVRYTEGGTTTTIYSGVPAGVGFTNTATYQTLSYPIALPPGSIGIGGHLSFEIANDQVEYRRIEIVPQYNGNGFVNGGTLAPAVTAASTITPTGAYFYLNGTATINNINIPPAFQGGSFCAIPTAVLTTTTTGNIGQVSTTAPNRVICWLLDPSGPKWYPSY